MIRGVLVLALLCVVACGSGSTPAGHMPSPVANIANPTPPESAAASPRAEQSPIPTTSPVATAAVYGIVVKDFLIDGGATYTVSLIRNDGAVQTSVTARKRSLVQRFLVQEPNISASNSRLYYLDGDAAVRFLLPDGTTGAVKTLPVDSSSAAIFAVSPDDSKIAVAILTYPYPLKTQIYVEDLYGNGNHVELYASSSAVEWPVGWHQDRLVIGVGINDPPQNAWDGFAYMQSGYHVVNAATGLRLATICAEGSVFAPPTAAGTVCRTNASYMVSDWAGATRILPTGDGCRAGVLSTDGLLVADFCNSGVLRLVTDTGGVTITKYTVTPQGWIDRLHVVEVAQSGQLSILNVQLMSVTAIDTQGFFAGTVPASL